MIAGLRRLVATLRRRFPRAVAAAQALALGTPPGRRLRRAALARDLGELATLVEQAEREGRLGAPAAAELRSTLDAWRREASAESP